MSLLPDGLSTDGPELTFLALCTATRIDPADGSSMVTMDNTSSDTRMGKMYEYKQGESSTHASHPSAHAKHLYPAR